MHINFYYRSRIRFRQLISSLYAGLYTWYCDAYIHTIRFYVSFLLFWYLAIIKFVQGRRDDPQAHKLIVIPHACSLRLSTVLM